MGPFFEGSKQLQASPLSTTFLFDVPCVGPFFEGPGVQGLKGSRVQGYKGSRVQGCKGPRVQGFQGSRVQGFKGLKGLKGPRVRVQGFKVPGLKDPGFWT